MGQLNKEIQAAKVAKVQLQKRHDEERQKYAEWKRSIGLREAKLNRQVQKSEYENKKLKEDAARTEKVTIHTTPLAWEMPGVEIMMPTGAEAQAR